ncbi:MAG: HAD-IA family hydrolase [Candidatus Paceibacterota bacterium]
MINGYDVDETVVSMVKKLREAGYKTAICSNNFPARINGLQDKFGFLNDFGIVALSYEVGESKPSKKIFEELVRKSGVEAGSIVFADDNSDNLDGAKEVGITTFLYEGFEKYLEQLTNIGVKI